MVRALRGYALLKFAIGLSLELGDQHPYLTIQQVNNNRDDNINSFYATLRQKFVNLNDESDIETSINFDNAESLRPVKFRFVFQTFLTYASTLNQSRSWDWMNVECEDYPNNKFNGYGIDETDHGKCNGVVKNCQTIWGNYRGSTVNIQNSYDEDRLIEGYKFKSSGWKGRGSEAQSKEHPFVSFL